MCLIVGLVPALWKKAWILMIFKPYDWNGVFTNTWSIALIETARKIFSKILSDHILMAWYVHIISGVCCWGSVVGFVGHNRINRVITNFSLSGGYRVYNGLDQGESRDMNNCVGIELILGLFQRLDRLKVVKVSSRIFQLYALNIANKFFEINDISINSGKTVTIPINQNVKVALLSICEQPILIAKKSEAHHYLSIFLFTEGLSKSSVIKAHADVCFFVNIMLRKAITDKQFLYLVSAVLQLIVSYHIQFSFVPSSVCHKWNVLVKKGFKSKACLLRDFFNAALYHSLLYGLKSFEQVQSEGKVTTLIMFSNAPGILGCLFSYRFLDLQVLGWAPLDLLQFPVRLRVNLVNNFLAKLVKIFLDNKLSLANNLSTVFCSSGHFPLSSILGKSLYFDSVKSLKRFGVTFRHWKRLNLHNPIPHWSVVVSEFFLGKRFLSSGTLGSFELCGLDVLGSSEFSAIKNGLHDIWSGFFKVYTDGSLKNAGSAEVVGGAAAYFLVLDLSIGVAIQGLLSSTMAELQAVALSLECVPFSSTVVLHLDSQAAIDACISEMSLAIPDFHNQYWLERHHIFNLVRNKDLNVSWAKVKGYFGIPGNVRANLATGTASGSPFSLLANVREHFLVAESTAVSGNACHFVQNIFWSVCCACWEAGSGCDVISNVIVGCVNWVATARVWHSDSHILTGFTSYKSSTLCSYMMKAVHRKLLVVVRKRLYNRCYPGVLCLLCGGVEFSDHTFTYVHESDICNEILVEASACWSVVAGVFDCFSETCCVVNDQKLAVAQIVDFIRFIVELHHARVWLVRSSHRVVIEKAGLVQDSSIVSGLFCGVSFLLFDNIVRLLGVAKSFAKSYSFFSGLKDSVQVIIGV
ncbi:hypothetical protein G9A89_002995 [Geosiphon pyriformis]|nr:hypothetical protein G9A89_002995 [Geosiphon pyriformis]